MDRFQEDFGWIERIGAIFSSKNACIFSMREAQISSLSLSLRTPSSSSPSPLTSFPFSVLEFDEPELVDTSKISIPERDTWRITHPQAGTETVNCSVTR